MTGDSTGNVTVVMKGLGVHNEMCLITMVNNGATSRGDLALLIKVLRADVLHSP